MGTINLQMPLSARRSPWGLPRNVYDNDGCTGGCPGRGPGRGVRTASIEGAFVTNRDASIDDAEAPRPDAALDWFAPERDSEGLPYYLAVLRSHVWLIVVTVIVCLGATMLYLTQVEEVYQSHADLLITPIPRDNETFIGLGLPRESSDPTRDVETVVRLIETPAVAGRVVDSLGLDLSPRQLLAKVDPTPVASSNVVSVTAKANDPKLAARIANAFGNASVDYRTDRLHDQLDLIIPQLLTQIAELGADEAARDALAARLRDLTVLRALEDPTLHLETRAVPSSAPIAPRRMLSIAAAILAGLIVGGAAALGSELFDRRLRREEQLRRYRIPILARLPFERGVSHSRESSPLPPRALSATAHSSYLLVGTKLSVNHSGDEAQRSVLVTGPNRGDGTTTAALNLATAISRSWGVVLVEADFVRPMLRSMFRLRPKHSVTDVVARRIPLADALVRRESEAPGVALLVQRAGEAPLSAVMTPANADWLIRETHLLAAWLVVDSPPLTIVPDALPLAKQVDDVLLVVRLGNTRLNMLEELAELLVQQGIRPSGFVLVGGRPATANVQSWLETLTARRQIRHRDAGRRSATVLKRASSLLQQSRSPQTEPAPRTPQRDLPRQQQRRREGEETKRRPQERRTD